ncbi:sulfite exporter TauE/SafE family protein [uncultured Nocardioides sp.]|uniref:sulfite exporter TauE/SafE family protein n=1 Tax=uncultured Nocardioides sp. TaxID=198441 RepID=UPI002612CE3D|nr:sulfite exporter TauE/SafE family protein [uncultured Nocardioides sp.]
MAAPLIALCCGFVVALITTPVGVSGAVLLLPVQLDVLKVPNPSITPTNLLYNVVAGPGALVRLRARLRGSLVGRLLAGTLPGVVLGACIRVWLVPDPRTFRLVAAAVLLGLGTWLVERTLRPVAGHGAAAPIRTPALVCLAFAVGTLGGIYGIGGGSILAPILVGRGMAVAEVAPAALASTFVTSVAGVASFAVIAVGADGSVTPDWTLGLAAGLGGLVGGYWGARLAPRVPEVPLRLLLGGVCIALAAAYVIAAL